MRIFWQFITVYFIALTFCMSAHSENYQNYNPYQAPVASPNEQLYRTGNSGLDSYDEGRELSAYERKRQAVEQYLDYSRGNRGVQERSYRRPTRQRSSDERNRRFSQRANRWQESESAPRRGRLSYEPANRQPAGYNGYQGYSSQAPQSAPVYETGPRPGEGVRLGQSELLKVKQWLQGGAQPQRRASLSSRNENVFRVEEDEDDEIGMEAYQTRASLSLLGGISQLSNPTASGNTSENENVPDNIYLGLQLDMSFWKFLGLEVDGYYGIAPALETVVVADGESEETATGTSQSIQHSGVMGNLKAQLPIEFNKFSLIPKLGIGYGMNMLKAVELGEESTESLLAAKGMYFMAGADILPTPKLKLFVDFASSLGAGSPGDSATGELASFGFTRTRVGISYNIYSKFSLGTQYISRSFKAAEAGGVAPPSLTQFLGVLMYEL